MRIRFLRLFAVFGFVACAASPVVLARDLRITIPGHSELTPVQRLNRQGVDAIQKQQYEKAEGIFYKAYLYDPGDPFTLNNLGYVAELQGQLDRAEKFYKLAAEQGCEAIIDRSNVKGFQGKPMLYALDSLKNAPMRVNRINVLGIELLSQDRAFEAEPLLKEGLALDPQNPFTLNNLGVTEEAMGDFKEALKYYDQAAASGSTEPIVVTLKRSWRGKPVSQMAAVSAQELRKRMQNMNLYEARAAMLAIRGVSATNRNDWSAARKDFLEAYFLNPNSAFALNNLGYVAEKDGDPETAQFYYARARRATDASEPVGLATQLSAQGQQLNAIADASGQKVDSELDAYSRSRRGQEGSIELIPRGNSSDRQEITPATPLPGNPSTESPSNRQSPQ